MNNNQGSIVITIVLIMLIFMTSAAVILSGVLTKHTRASRDYLLSERAFAGANSGVERMLYQVMKVAPESGDYQMEEETIEYEDGTSVKYKGCADSTKEQDKLIPHMASSGSIGSLVRRIQLGGGKDCAV
jgi:Tfp pilus assembly protein PilX